MTHLGIDIGLRNFSYCVIRTTAGGVDVVDVVDWQLVDLMEMCGFAKGFSCNRITSKDLHDIGDFVFPLIFSCDYMNKHGVNHIAIEQQPHGRLSNPKMIALTHILYSYMRSLFTNLKCGSPLRTVVLMAASQKYNTPLLARFGFSKQKDYKERKLLSVKLVQAILGTVDFPHGVTKVDDLADSFLLAYVNF
jgi:hypothetical protein